MSHDDLPRYRAPSNLVWADGAEMGLGDALYLTVVPEGRTVQLPAIARLIWLIAIEGADVLEELAALIGPLSAEATQQSEVFLSELEDAGLLTRLGPAAKCAHAEAAQ